MKTWIKTNLSKITLALTSAVSGVTGLIIGSLAHHKTNDLQYFLDYDYEAHWGATIWAEKTGTSHIIALYFSNKPKSDNDVKMAIIQQDILIDKIKYNQYNHLIIL